MKKLLTYLLSLVLLSAPTQLIAQSNDSKLANHYFSNGDFEKAKLYFEKLYKQNPSTYNFDKLLACHTNLIEYNKAEKLVKGHIRKKPSETKYLIILGALYEQNQEENKAEKEYEKALKNLRPEPSKIRAVANAFINANKHQYALDTYERGEKLLKGSYYFHYEKANLLGMMGETKAMVISYLDLIETNAGYLQTVQNSLARYIDINKNDAHSDLLRDELLRRIQRQPDKIIFQEMLIWIHIQQGDMNSAMIHSKGLDKRQKEGGKRLIELAQIASGNGNYHVAKKCYDYVADLGTNSRYFKQARMGAVNVLDLQFKEEKLKEQDALTELDGLYGTTLIELGKTTETLDLIKNSARLKAYYLNNVEGARALLEEALTIPSMSVKERAEIKLELGDLHILQNDIWEASLYYSQVDLDFKHDILGHDARFRNSRVSYYAGDFLWCQAQLDVLKASTSKLIANDAMELSLLITDNLGLDSNATPLSAFSRAELLIFQHRFDEAKTLLDTLENAYPMHALADDVLFQRYRIEYAQANYDSAATHLTELLDLYGLDMLADNALWSLGTMYEDKVHDKEKALGYYEQLLFDHPGSIFVIEARKRFRAIRGENDPDQEPLEEDKTKQLFERPKDDPEP